MSAPICINVSCPRRERCPVFIADAVPKENQEYKHYEWEDCTKWVIPEYSHQNKEQDNGRKK